MLTEYFVAATLAESTKSNTSSTLKDVGIVLHELQPQSTLRQGLKKSSAKINCVAISNTHIFAAQADKAIVHVYSRGKGNQEATIAFPERIRSLAYAGESSGFLVLGTDGGKLILWDVASGRQTISEGSHIQAVSYLSCLPDNSFILSGSSDSNIHVWSLSNLVSFAQSQALSSNDPAPKAPLRTFPNHRSPISALDCGHSKLLTPFAVSASNDSTCYIWKVADCQVLRTILYPSAALSIVVDPADRAIYSGHGDGSIHCFDFFRHSRDHTGISSSASPTPKLLRPERKWSPASADIGSAQCLTLSYDGTVLLSGHSSGKILSWDIAKQRVQRLITDLGNSVTNIAIQRPDRLPTKSARVEVRTVVKPKLESSSSSVHQIGTSGIPTDYSLRVQITAQSRLHSASFSQYLDLTTPPPEPDFFTLLTGPTFPNALLNEAILDLTSQSSDHDLTTSYDIPFAPPSQTRTPNTAAVVETLQSRITDLEATLSSYTAATQRSRARRLERMRRREEFGRRKREAYFETVENRSAHGVGGNGKSDLDVDVDVEKEAEKAMEIWEQKEEEVDRESDEVEYREEVYGDV